MRWECRIHVIVSSISLLFAWIVLPVGPLDFRTGTVSASTQIEYSAKRNDTSPSNKWQVKQWVQQLGHPSFRKREEASQKLKNGGLPATAALIQVIGDDPEVNLRAIQLLNHLFKGGYPPDEDVTVEALYELACQGSPAVYEWAMDVLARRYQDGDDNTKQSLEKGVLQNLSKSRNKDVANMAQEILYPFPSDVQTGRLLKDIINVEKKIRHLKGEIDALEKRNDLTEPSRQSLIQLSERTIGSAQQTIIQYEQYLLKYRMNIKQRDQQTKDVREKRVLNNPSNSGKQVDANIVLDPVLTGRFLPVRFVGLNKDAVNKGLDETFCRPLDYSTRRVLKAITITEEHITLYECKIKEIEKADLPDATAKHYIGAHQGQVRYLEEKLRWFEEDLKERGMTMKKESE